MIVQFEKGRDGSPMCVIDGKVSFPPRGSNVLVGDEWEVEINGSNPKGTVNFLKLVRLVSSIQAKIEAERERDVLIEKIPSYNAEGGLFEIKFGAWQLFFKKIAEVVKSRHVGDYKRASYYACPKCGIETSKGKNSEFDKDYDLCHACGWHNNTWYKRWNEGGYNKGGYNFSQGGFSGSSYGGNYFTERPHGTEYPVLVPTWKSPALLCQESRFPFPFPLNEEIINKMSKRSTPGIPTKGRSRDELAAMVKALESCPMPPSEFVIGDNESSEDIWNRLRGRSQG